ncbi:MAG: IclR family transcriptional regulator [Clostridia bacterium]|nr:IclR family transcriptional regulator [Clostridia bacterium]
MSNNDNTPDWQVKSVTKAFNILSCFTPNETELSLADISAKLKMPKSTTLNLLRTLESFGYVMRSYPSMNYRLGYSAMQLKYCTQMSMPVIRYALPFLEDLQIRTGKTIYLTSHINGKVLYLEVAHQNRRIFSYSINGKTLPMHCTGCGKAMLAFLPDAEIENIITEYNLPTFTPNTISDKNKLLSELEEIRNRGYAFDNEEESLGIRCIAAPIRNSQGYPTAALSISGAVNTMQDEQLLGYLDVLLSSCQALANNANEFPAGQILLLNQHDINQQK